MKLNFKLTELFKLLESNDIFCGHGSVQCETVCACVCACVFWDRMGEVMCVYENLHTLGVADAYEKMPCPCPSVIEKQDSLWSSNFFLFTISLGSESLPGHNRATCDGGCGPVQNQVSSFYLRCLERLNEYYSKRQPAPLHGALSLLGICL